MALEYCKTIDLPGHRKTGGFDHAAYECHTGRIYVAHTANDALDVLASASGRYLYSIPDLAEVAGVLSSDERELVFTANRGEDTVSIFRPANEAGLFKVAVGARPNGLAFDPGRAILLAACTGEPFSLSVVDLEQRDVIATIAAPGRPRWAYFDPWTDYYYVNIASPACIAAVPGEDPDRIAFSWPVPAAGPHGLDFDNRLQRIYCACDARILVALDVETGKVLRQWDLNGKPDVVFFNHALRRLYVASGEPGLIDVFDMNLEELIQSVPTAPGAHTIGFDADRNQVFAFVPDPPGAMMFLDNE